MHIKLEKEKVFETLKDEVLKQSGEEHIRRGQYDALMEFSKFWVNFDEQLYPLLKEHRTQVEEAIMTWIKLQMDNRNRVS